MNQVGEEIVYTPVLYLDTLKVSSIEKSAESSFATGGLKNKQLIKWNYGKTLKMTLEDALFSPASMSLIWGGKLDNKLGLLMSVISKINFANTYGRLHYSTKAYPSPTLTDDELLVCYKILAESYGLASQPQGYDGENWYCDPDWDVEPNNQEEYDNLKKAFLDRYINRPNEFNYNGIEWDGITSQEKYGEGEIKTGLVQYTCDYDKIAFNNLYYSVPYASISNDSIEGMENNTEKFNKNGYMKPGTEYLYFAKAMPEFVVVKIREIINDLSQISNVGTNTTTVQTVDRMEKCIVTERNGLIINGQKQLDNIFRYYANDYSSSYTIYYDAKTMLPLMHVTNNEIDSSQGDFKLKLGTVYYKWTRTVKYDEYNDDTLGRSFIIDADTFPDDYKIVGETYIRNQKTGKDNRYQIVIYKANISSDTSITLQADGDPTTFSMSIDILSPENDILMELIQLDVEEDKFEGGTRIVPQKKKYSYTPSQLTGEEVAPPIDNLEIY